MPRIPDRFLRYFEPFVGGGAVFYALSPQLCAATLADSNLELILTYKAVQKEPTELIRLLRRHAARHSKTYYYKIRSEYPKTPIEVAARFIYLNKTAYNGLYRVNKSGRFNAPMGRYTNPNIVLASNILTCSQALAKADFLFGDFQNIKPKPGDFVYFDPPYHPTDETSFVAYTKESFSEKDQIRLRDFIEALTLRGVHVMLSNSKTRFISGIYKSKHFSKQTVRAPRFVNCKPGERDKVEELLITNY